MAIEPVKRLWLVVLKEVAPEVLERLYHLGCIHLAEVPQGQRQGQRLLSQVEAELAQANRRLQQLGVILSVLDEFAPSKKGFLADLLGLPLEVGGAALERALGSLDVPALARQCRRLRSRYEEAARRLAEVRRQIQYWKPVRGIAVPFVSPEQLRQMVLTVGWLPAGRLSALQERAAGTEGLAWEVLRQVNGRLLLALAAPQEHRDRLRQVALDVGVGELPVPEGYSDSEEYLTALEEEEAALLVEQVGVREEVRKLAGRRNEVLALLGYWERVAGRTQAVGRVGFLERVAIIKGYVRERDLSKVAGYLDRQPGVAAVYEEPTPDEEVPVSLRTGRLFAPAQFLVRMFGLPGYFSFDPTPYLTLSFLLFFGICFGDAIYGLVLIGLALWLARKVWDYVSLRQMFLLFAYAGVATCIVGVLTGSWCSNLYDYLGEGNLLLRIKESTAFFDPLDKPLIALLVALAIGIANQLWAVLLRMYGAARQHDYAGAVFDGGLWLLFLPGLVLLIGAAMAEGAPAWVWRTGLGLVVVSAIGLVLTQGRREQGILAKAITGIVSLYGILGTYGTTSFIGDVLSYSRLLALGLTTVIVGMSFNILAGLVKTSLGPLGWPAFVLVVVFGHTFNFFISILGGFVHSARLIFVEFFGRFYGGGAPAFLPFGREPGRVRLVSETAVSRD